MFILFLVSPSQMQFSLIFYHICFDFILLLATKQIFSEIWTNNFSCTVLFFFTAKAIDEYAALRMKAAESKAKSADVDPRLEAIVERMLDKYVFFCVGLT